VRREVPKGNANHFTWDLLRELNLETVCENAKCPNRMECYSQKTATFMVMGNVCTRPCGFCAVSRGRPEELELDEPERVAEAAARLGMSSLRRSRETIYPMEVASTFISV
jgi:lipoic acid synthetase